MEAYDEDAALAVSHLLSLSTCNGRIGTTGMCLGGHLAFRCALDTRVAAAVCYFATDIHAGSLGKGGDDSLSRIPDISGELVMVIAPPRSGHSLMVDFWQKRQSRAARR